MQGVRWLERLCLWLGIIFLALAGFVAYDTIHQIYFPLSFGLGYQPRFAAALLALFPLLLTFVPWGVWGILVTLREIHDELQQQTQLLSETRPQS